MNSSDLQIAVQGEKFFNELPDAGSIAGWHSGLQLISAFKSPSQQEISAFQSGEFEIAINQIDNIPFISFRVLIPAGRGFGDQKFNVAIPWQECPFHASRIDPMSLERIEIFSVESRKSPDLRLSVNALLLNFPDHIIQSMRIFSLSPFASRKLCSSVLGSKDSHTSESYRISVEKIYNYFPVNAIGESSRVRCKSGD